MFAKIHKENGTQRRGLVAVQVAVMLPIILGCAALTIDVGIMYNAKADLQRTADVAASAAAAELNNFGTRDHPLNPAALARAVAEEYAALNPVLGQEMQLARRDVVFGQVSYDPSANSYSFTNTESFPNALRVIVRKTHDSPNGALDLYFAGIFGQRFVELTAEGTALLIPRDIVAVVDLSGSTSYDSQLRHYDLPEPFEIDQFNVWGALPIASGRGGIRNGADPPAPLAAHSADDQPATGAGVPGIQGGNPNPNAEPFDGMGDHGPRFGWMTGYGAELYPRAGYSPATDVGLYYIKRGRATTDPAVIDNLIEAGYSADERAALLNAVPGRNYDTSTSRYRRRVKVLLGLAGWRSKKAGSKFTGGPGDGDNVVDSNELTHNVAYPYDADTSENPSANSGSWNSYVDYVTSYRSPMNTSAANFRYRYGLKTFIDYILVKKAAHAETPELADTPAQPLHAIKQGVATLVDRLSDYETSDQMGLVSYATNGHWEVGMELMYDVDTGVYSTAVHDRVLQLQPAHYNLGTAYTNIQAGILEAIEELTSERARTTARKSMVVLTDGNANYYLDSSGSPRYGRSTARMKAKAAARQAADMGFQIHTVSVGGDADTTLMAEIADIGGGTWSHASGTIAEYTAQLNQIFAQLATGGTRPVAIIE